MMRSRVVKLIALVVCALPVAMLGAAMLAAFGEAPTRWAANHHADWLGFMGAIVGGVMTLAAAALAFGLTREQVELQRAELASLRQEQQRRGEAVVEMVLHTALAIHTAAGKAQDHYSVYSGEPAPRLMSFQETVGYTELWRTPRAMVLAIMSADLAIASFNESVSVDNIHVRNEQRDRAAFITGQCLDVIRASRDIIRRPEG